MVFGGSVEVADHVPKVAPDMVTGPVLGPTFDEATAVDRDDTSKVRRSCGCDDEAEREACSDILEKRESSSLSGGGIVIDTENDVEGAATCGTVTGAACPEVGGSEPGNGFIDWSGELSFGC